MLDGYIDEIIMLGMVQLLGVASPGPDFAIVVRNSLVSGRRAGIFTALGITTGAAIHVTWAIFGLGAVIHQTPMILRAIQLVGAAYLTYLGIKGIMVKPSIDPAVMQISKTPILQRNQAYMNGLLTNLLNVKAILFIISVLSGLISPTTPNYVMIGYLSLIVAITQSWFSIVSLVLTQPIIRKRFLLQRHWIERAMGVFMILLAIKIVLGI